MSKIFVTFLLLYGGLLFSEDPWGKDAELLTIKPTVQCEALRQSFLAKAGEKMIRFHQEVISPADGPRSHFIPSSSQYTLDAMREYGFFKGVVLGCDRLMRENSDPWVYQKVKAPDGQIMKWNPVPHGL